MIIEHEILEQISEETWPLYRVIAFIRRYKAPWPVIEALYKDRCIELIDINEYPIAEWKAETLLRTKADANIPALFVRITAKGLERAYG